MNLTLKRIDQTDNSTVGLLKHGNKFLAWTIEDAQHEPKIYGKTRIPAGTYTLQKATNTKFNTIYYTKYKMNWVLRVLDVPNFEGIEIHIGNTQEETNGCILPNSSVWHDEELDNYEGAGSVPSLKMLYKYLDPVQEEITLTIIDPI